MPVTANWDSYGTAMTHAVFGNLAANGIVNAIPSVNIPLASYPGAELATVVVH